MPLTEQQLRDWNDLPDHQMTLRRLADLGIAVKDIAEAEEDGLAPRHATDVITLPVVQAAIDRLSRARLADQVARLSVILETLEERLTAPRA